MTSAWAKARALCEGRGERKASQPTSLDDQEQKGEVLISWPTKEESTGQTPLARRRLASEKFLCWDTVNVLQGEIPVPQEPMTCCCHCVDASGVCLSL